MTFFFSYLWPMIKHNYQSNTDCNKANCNCNNNPEYGEVGRITENGIDYCTCQIDNGQKFTCVYKG